MKLECNRIRPMKTYIPRVSDVRIAEELAGMGAVLVQGAKWCGKTTSCEQFAKSALYMADPKKRDTYLKMAENDVSELLKGDKPRLIDEWQDAPQFWDAVRYDVDHADECGQFILTGSATPPDPERISHSGTGRIARVTMRPMSLWESGESSGSVSLGKLFNGSPFEPGRAQDRSLAETAFLVCRGGWPRAVLQKGHLALRRAFDYYDSVVNADINRADKTMRDPERVKRLMRSYARLQGTQSGLKAIKLDMAANEPKSFDEDTVASYVNALKKIFVVEDMSAWCPNLRNKAVVRTCDTRYFTDPSIAVAALGVGPRDLMDDLNTFGLLFEAMAVRDLRCYVGALDGSVSHYRDGSGLECDAVVHLRNGSYGLVEVKLGGETLIASGADSLLRLARKLDVTKMRKPSFLMVLVAHGEFAYRRNDGVLVVPISALKP